MTPLQDALLSWYRRERRDLPWRRTRDPYAIWISEAMLQQTTVAAVTPYWERWMTRFPTVEALAAAPLDDVLATWQGLGYYRRARSLHAGAALLAERGIPGTALEWREVPGVGPYTAAAVASIAFGDPAALVDGNVERVYTRLAADDGTGAARHRRAWRWAEENLVREAPGDWNQALMEHGATICRPLNPACLICPVQQFCRAFELGRQNEIPVREARPEPTQLRWSAVVPLDAEGRVGLERVPEGEWWAGMWHMPTFSGELPEAWAGADARGSVKAGVTRYRIHIEVYRYEGAPPGRVGLRWFRPEELAGIAISNPHRRVLKVAGL